MNFHFIVVQINGESRPFVAAELGAGVTSVKTSRGWALSGGSCKVGWEIRRVVTYEYPTQFEMKAANAGKSSSSCVMVLGPRPLTLLVQLRIRCLARCWESQFASAQWLEWAMIDAVSGEKYRALFPRKADGIFAYLSRQP